MGKGPITLYTPLKFRVAGNARQRGSLCSSTQYNKSESLSEGIMHRQENFLKGFSSQVALTQHGCLSASFSVRYNKLSEESVTLQPFV
jgi:hypothetical protein